MINIFNPFEEKYFNKKSIANKEDKNVVIRPTKRGKKPNSKSSLKEEKKAKTNIVRFETSTSPNWKDIKIFIRKDFLKP